MLFAGRVAVDLPMSHHVRALSGRANVFMQISISFGHLSTIMVNASQGSWFFLPALLEARQPELDHFTVSW